MRHEPDLPRTLLTNWCVGERRSRTHGRVAQYIGGRVGLRGDKNIHSTSAVVRVRVVDSIVVVETTHGVYGLLGPQVHGPKLRFGDH